MKRTQGNKKFNQYFNDLKRNLVFQNKIKKLRKYFKSDADARREKEREIAENYLIERYLEYKNRLKKKLDSLPKIKHWNISSEIAEDYGLDNEFTENLILSELLMKKNFDITEEDMCCITENYEKYLNNKEALIPIEFDKRKQNHIRVFPISIDIHKFASKRDVLDFIEKRWNVIEKNLNHYRGKKVRFRSRKFSQKLLDFIWDKRGLEIGKLKSEIDKNYPMNNLVYNEIYTIINTEKIRRSKKIIVGQ